MHQLTASARTIKELSPAELAAYSERLDAHFRNRQIDEALLQRAWQTAYRVAGMLYEDFGATRVAVFGSLAEREWFSPRSDIDIAVWGLPSRAYFRAVSETVGFSSEFKIDLVDFESCKGRFRERVESQAVPIQIGKPALQPCIKKREEIDEVNTRALVQRISEEHAKIAGKVERIREDLPKIEAAPPAYRESLEAFVARHLYDFYKGLENIFTKIAGEVDGNLPRDPAWHQALLRQMSEARGKRPPVLSEKTSEVLRELLGFRHVFVYIYAEELDYERTVENALLASEVFDSVSEELQRFIAWLEKQDTE